MKSTHQSNLTKDNAAAVLPMPLQTNPRKFSIPTVSPYRVILACSVCRSEHVSEAPGLSQRTFTATPLGQIYFAGQQFGAVCPRNGIPHLTSYCEQWILERTGQRSRLRDLFVSDIHKPNPLDGDGEPEQQLCPASPSHFAGDPALPEKRILESLVADFRASDFSLVFPLINPLLFEETLRMAYDADGAEPTLEGMTAKACVLAFASLSSSHFPTSESSADIDSDLCAKAAQSLIAEIIEDASVTTLQTVFFLLLHDTLCGRLQASSMYHALACRIVFVLGGHRLNFTVPRDRDMTKQEHEDRHLRMFFWLCYIFDKDIALRTGQPPIIADQFCDLTLPDGYDEYRFSGRQRSPGNGPLQNSWLPGDLRLSMVKSKALQTLYSCTSLRMSDAELLKTIRELDEDLESWRTSVPEAFSPSLSIRKDVKLAQDASFSQNILLIELHMDYHYLLNIIHSASGRCKYHDGNPAQSSTVGVQSSFEISVEASRSTLIFLSKTASGVAGEAFWFFIFYPLSALMTLFFNILQNPGHSLAVHDMKLLGKASQIIRRMPIRRVTPHETEYLVKMDRVAAELSRLSNCAIERHTVKNSPC
ncbi:hypothetical protein E4U55_006814 [Claviceps digitariae]|nr:hypothetical protein E4U55_006814 [Claviceps digitariae]